MRQKFLKLGAFVVAGLALIGTFYTLGKSSHSTAAAKDGQAFGDWTVSCAKVEKDKKQICSSIQSLSVVDKANNKQTLIATYQFVYLNNGKELKLIQTLPEGYQIQSGTGIIAEEKVLAPGKFTLCKEGFCYAVSEVDDSTLNTILNNEKVNIGMINHEGKQAHFLVSTKGLKEALATIKE